MSRCRFAYPPMTVPLETTAQRVPDSGQTRFHGNERVDPSQIRALCAQAVMLDAQALMNNIEQSGFWGRRVNSIRRRVIHIASLRHNGLSRVPPYYLAVGQNYMAFALSKSS